MKSNFYKREYTKQNSKKLNIFFDLKNSIHTQVRFDKNEIKLH